MGWDYAIVHLKYTIPLAIALTAVYRPFFTRLDAYKLVFLVSVAIISTIPWDSYLIRHRIWSYPPDAVLGYTLLDIPAEEVFFFFIQTYNTSFIYFILSKPTFHPIYLIAQQPDSDNAHLWRSIRTLGQLVLGGVIYIGYRLFSNGGEGVYMGLILIWAGPFVFVLWTLAHQLLTTLPPTTTLLPIALPTLYLWIVDTFALQRGTWVIESGTKLDLYLWPNLELEEAVFFLATNVLIIFGLVAFDNALAIRTAFPSLFASSATPTPLDLVEALLTSPAKYDADEISALRDAVQRLRNKSRSFYLASGTFQGLLRKDLILLYSYCRVADDLIDNASSVSESRAWIQKLRTFLDIVFSPSKHPQKWDFVRANFPQETQSALLYLPTSRLTPGPLYDLLKGFEMDLQFSSSSSSSPQSSAFPIQSETDLRLYSSRVAGTIAELVLSLVTHHTADCLPASKVKHLLSSGHQMGIALQLINIARDIHVDAAMGRVYIPSSWLGEYGMKPGDVLKGLSGRGPSSNMSTSAALQKCRQRLLDMAFGIYESAISSIEDLPSEVQGPMRVAVESYVEIGAVLRQQEALGDAHQAGQPRKATVPKMQRIRIAYRAMSGPLHRDLRRERVEGEKGSEF